MIWEFSWLINKFWLHARKNLPGYFITRLDNFFILPSWDYGIKSPSRNSLVAQKVRSTSLPNSREKVGILKNFDILQWAWTTCSLENQSPILKILWKKYLDKVPSYLPLDVYMYFIFYFFTIFDKCTTPSTEAKKTPNYVHILILLF